MKTLKVLMVLFVVLFVSNCELDTLKPLLENENGVSTNGESTQETDDQTGITGDYENDILLVVHETAFKKLFKKTYPKTVDYTISGPEGGTARITKTSYGYDKDFTIEFLSYKMSGYVVNGSFSWYTGFDYTCISNPPTAAFINTGGGNGGTLEISGQHEATIPVSIDFFNLLDGIEYKYNDILEINYNVAGTDQKREVKMIHGVYRRTFREAHLELMHKPIEGDSWRPFRDGESVSINGPQGGTATLSARLEKGSTSTRQHETYTFSNYGANDLVLNGSITISYTRDNYTGEIIEGCDEEYFMDVTGYYETRVKHIAIVHKPAAIWNFRMGYFVDGFYYESVSVQIMVGVGFAK